MTAPYQLPKWAQPFKNEWMSAAVMGRRFTFDSCSVQSFVVQHAKTLRPRATTGMNGKPARYYRVKDVMAAARAHGLQAQPIGHDHAPDTLRDIIDDLGRRLSTKTLREESSSSELTAWRWAVTALVEALPTKRDDVAGIYFLFHNEKLVYIGQSKNIGKRVGGHAALGQVVDLRVLPIAHPSPRGQLEAILIRLLRPALNRAHNGGDDPVVPIPFE